MIMSDPSGHMHQMGSWIHSIFRTAIEEFWSNFKNHKCTKSSKSINQYLELRQNGRPISMAQPQLQGSIQPPALQLRSVLKPQQDLHTECGMRSGLSRTLKQAMTSFFEIQGCSHRLISMNFSFSSLYAQRDCIEMAVCHRQPAAEAAEAACCGPERYEYWFWMHANLL